VESFKVAAIRASSERKTRRDKGRQRERKREKERNRGERRGKREKGRVSQDREYRLVEALFVPRYTQHLLTVVRRPLLIR